MAAHVRARQAVGRTRTRRSCGIQIHTLFLSGKIKEIRLDSTQRDQARVDATVESGAGMQAHMRRLCRPHLMHQGRWPPWCLQHPVDLGGVGHAGSSTAVAQRLPLAAHGICPRMALLRARAAHMRVCTSCNMRTISSHGAAWWGCYTGCIGATSDVGRFSVVLADAARMKVTVECIAWDVGFCSFGAQLGPAIMDSDHFGCTPKQ